MRPIELIMSAFGPYAEKQVIDFDTLGRSGLYLITGDTGAGKTTIFDAISFALFGSASGEGRDAKMLRSKYAGIETPTFVELKFEYNGKEYTVHRNPEYERQSKRGDKLTKQTADAYLILPDGRTISKVNEVTEYIEDLLGINRDQFAQIAMIAQGEFKRLLNAETDDRKKIFRKLFKTEKYDALQNYLKSEANTLERECQAKTESIKQYIDGIMADETSVLNLKVEDLKAGKMLAAEAKTVLDELIEEDTDSFEENQEELDEVEKKLGEIKSVFDKIEEEKKARENLERSKAELEASKKRQQGLESDLALAEQKKGEIELLKDAASKLEGDLPLYKEREEKRREYAKKKTEYEQSVSARDEKAAQLKECGGKVSGLKEEQKNYKGAEAEMADLRMAQAGIKAIEATFEKIGTARKRLGELRAKHAEMAEAFESAKKQRRVANEKYVSLSEKFLSAQAGILAKELKADEACPVCGSHEHPKPAKMPAEAPTEGQLKKAEADLRDADKVLNDVTAKAGKVDGMIKTAEDNLKSELLNVVDAEDAGVLAGENELEPMLAQADLKRVETAKKAEELEKLLGVVDAKIKRSKKLEEELGELQKLQEKLTSEIGELKEKVGVLKTEAEGLEKQGKELDKKLTFASEDLARAEIDTKKNRAKEFSDAIERARLKCAENKNKMAEVVGIIAALTEQLKNSTEVDVEKLSAEKEKIEGLREICKAEDRRINARITNNKRIRNNLEKGNEALRKMTKQYEIVRNLSDTANGTLKGKDRIMLEIYVQTTFFDRIIQRANTRFFVMTGGHFELKRSETVANKVNKSGLDLSVIDHYNGTERSVKSLSGGESFMASLSLALGLSDEIQMSVGGIRLATMFIDEGFGSLDTETLKLAMDALSELANPDGGRLVGIISHVEELKDRIDKQIVVTKNPMGVSEAKIVV